jgi:hypothetical protein
MTARGVTPISAVRARGSGPRVPRLSAGVGALELGARRNKHAAIQLYEEEGVVD